MDYLITNGYPSAAKKFAVEANIQLRTDLDSIQERVEIRTAIHSGNIRLAIEKINELNPQVRLTSIPQHHYHPSPPPFAMIISVSCTTPTYPPGSCGKTNIFSPQYEQNQHISFISQCHTQAILLNAMLTR